MIMMKTRKVWQQTFFPKAGYPEGVMGYKGIFLVLNIPKILTSITSIVTRYTILNVFSNSSYFFTGYLYCQNTLSNLWSHLILVPSRKCKTLELSGNEGESKISNNKMSFLTNTRSTEKIYSYTQLISNQAFLVITYT